MFQTFPQCSKIKITTNLVCIITVDNDRLCAAWSVCIPVIRYTDITVTGVIDGDRRVVQHTC